MPDEYLNLLRQFAWMAPQILVYGAGILFGLMNWRRYQPAAGIVALVSVASFIQIFVWPIATKVIVQRYDGSTDAIQNAFAIAGFINSVIGSILAGLMIWAVFVGRTRNPPSPPRPNQ